MVSMVTLTSLWLPILVSAVLVFIVSSILHMVLPYHKSDYKQLPDEEAVRAVLRKQNLAPAQYMFPYCADMKEMKNPEMERKWIEGPIGMLTIMRPGKISMGKPLALWFLNTVIISYIAAYLVARLLGPGTPYLEVFRAVGIAAFLGYAGASASSSIWLGRPWSVTAKDIFDGLIYASVTAGTFGWLWPR
jgi:hypothetical protein